MGLRLSFLFGFSLFVLLLLFQNLLNASKTDVHVIEQMIKYLSFNCCLKKGSQCFFLVFIHAQKGLFQVKKGLKILSMFLF